MILLFPPSSPDSPTKLRSAFLPVSTTRATNWRRVTDKMQRLALTRPLVAAEVLVGIENALDHLLIVEPTLEVDVDGRPIRRRAGA